MYSDGSSFTDHDIHRALRKHNIANPGGEWFCCTVADVQAAVLAVKNHTDNAENRTQNFPMRPEQQAAVNKTAAYFANIKAQQPGICPKFL